MSCILHGAIHPSVLWIEGFFFTVRLWKTVNHTYKKINLVWIWKQINTANSSALHRLLDHLDYGGCHFHCLWRVSYTAGMLLAQKRAASAAWAGFTHGAEFFYVNLGLLEPLQWKKTIDNFTLFVSLLIYVTCRHVPGSQPPFSLIPDPDQNKKDTSFILL